MGTTHYQHLSTKNDTNGNPRRLYVFTNIGGNVVKVINEGYAGKPKETKGLTELPGYNITPSEYRKVIKWAKEKGFYHD